MTRIATRPSISKHGDLQRKGDARSWIASLSTAFLSSLLSCPFQSVGGLVNGTQRKGGGHAHTRRHLILFFYIRK